MLLKYFSVSHAVDDNWSAFSLQSDNMRDQALNVMMGGVLELKKEDVLRMVRWKK